MLKSIPHPNNSNIKRLESCLLPALRNECGAETYDFTDQILERIFGSRFWLTCRNYKSDSSQCRSLLPAKDAKPYRKYE